MTKRPDIQIARTVAVLAVVGFHLGAPGFTNGFLGVDAFLCD
jgi:peptidoglycan/LPS O-acetylase OafA/YrhL